MTLNILQRINNAMKHEALNKIEKKKIDNLGYKCFTAEDVIEGCRPAMIENGIVFSIKNVKIEYSRYDKLIPKGSKTIHYFIIQGEAVFINIDNPEDKFETIFYGSAEDETDKAIGKANTYAKKIALMNTFLIQDGEDTDAVKSEQGLIKNSEKYSVEIKTSDILMQESLIKKDWQLKKGYRAKDENVYQKLIEKDKLSECQTWLQNKGFVLNTEKGYWENEKTIDLPSTLNDNNETIKLSNIDTVKYFF
jgi:hypothetical protein